MDKFFHRFSELFAQLGLPNGEADIRAFIEQHSPLGNAMLPRQISPSLLLCPACTSCRQDIFGLSLSATP